VTIEAHEGHRPLLERRIVKPLPSRPPLSVPPGGGWLPRNVYDQVPEFRNLSGEEGGENQGT